MDTHPRLPHQGLNQQFPRPSGPTPAVLLGRASHHPVQDREVVVIQLGWAIILARVPQAPLPVFAKATGHPVDGGVMHAEYLRRLTSGAAAEEIEDHQIAEPDGRESATAQVLAELLLDGEADAGENRRHGNSLLGRASASPRRCVVHREFPFSFVHYPVARPVQLNPARSFSFCVARGQNYVENAQWR